MNPNDKLKLTLASRRDDLREFEGLNIPPVHPDDILKIVLEEYDVTRDRFMGSGRWKTRLRRVVEAREAFVWLMHKTTWNSLLQMAEYMNSPSHSTIVNQYQRAREKYAGKVLDSLGNQTDEMFDQMRGVLSRRKAVGALSVAEKWAGVRA